VYIVNEGAAMEARRRDLVSRVRALDLRCRDAGEHGLSASLTRLGDEIEQMTHADLRRRAGRIGRALDVVRAMLAPPAAARAARHATPRIGRRAL
jgi:hypothetical protein